MKKFIFTITLSLFSMAGSLLAQNASMEHMAMDHKKAPSKKTGNTVYPVTGKIRTYYIAADEIPWDYMPGDTDAMTGKPYTGVEKLFAIRDSVRIGKVYLKAIYREYTDSTFTYLKQRPPELQYLGILGPVIRAEVGDVIHIMFKNNAHIPYSMHPHGVLYEKPSEGALYNKDDVNKNVDGNSVMPGSIFNYVWEVPERAGPGPNDPNSIVWLYHSHVNEPKDVNSGLVGPIIISARGTTKPDGTPKGVDKEFIALFMIFDENSSWYIDQNIRSYCGRNDSLIKVKLDVPTPSAILSILESVHASTFLGLGFAAANFRFTINGYSFGSMPMMTMRKGEKVRWYLLSLGNGINFHTPHWHGNTILYNGNRTDVIALSPAQMAVADMIPDNPGMWMFHCHVDDHMEAGMMAMYQVLE
ncbi:MAG TPA: multicopper oxidase domain-containing protein [Hanamia sp.]|nr:multicopper oxidase domain-containing protein [Hanamia sp.]